MLNRLDIQNFRNLKAASLQPTAGFNVFYGENGSGKTSLLEAIYFMSHGRSFRTTLLSRIIQEDQGEFNLFAEITEDASQKLGLSRHRDGSAKMRLNGKNLSSSADIAKILPVILFHPESFDLLTSGSRARRQLLDWGVFYTQSAFFKTWQDVKKCVEQRNAMLKTAPSAAMMASWNHGLSQAGELLDSLRAQYVEALNPLLQELLQDFLPGFALTLSYHRGWPKDQSLLETLQAHFAADLKAGHTLQGPHRADLRLKIQHVPAEEVLSRWQQKLLICALKIAQGRLLQSQTGRAPLYLLDDLASELDNKNRVLLLNQLKNLQAQVFLTSIEAQFLVQYLPELTRVFLIDQGTVIQE